MNIDFSLEPLFSTYVVLLLLSGVILLALTAPESSKGARIANLLFGIGFLAYGLYLAFVFDGGSYLILFKAFIVPVALIFHTVKTIIAKRNEKAAAAAAVAYNPVVPAAPAPLVNPAMEESR
ncbi:hypothetical protein Cs7R123_38430 [Catellatospora sp. TT07R-123]|uniref:hypothetical protein n=1 Tax=Catellatospora sp. TT07R-123 TaxID=2733863 RepID=UPI001B03B705|nr:hypothetical protein [Catellatospora sp. TT07R-123]GHJ46501.1 hypothetical protein Cs7R123_38430 [Catellatospora sp. TT07R-123]